MYDLLSVISWIALGIGVIVLVARYLDNRTRSKGALFSKLPSRKSRAGAFFLGMFFLGISIYQFGYTNQYSLIFPSITILLFAYSFNISNRLVELQNKGRSSPLGDEYSSDGVMISCKPHNVSLEQTREARRKTCRA